MRFYSCINIHLLIEPIVPSKRHRSTRLIRVVNNCFPAGMGPAKLLLTKYLLFISKPNNGSALTALGKQNTITCE